jgi:molybdopterin-containing oxidoreductase family iron-sulfur binding subunit
MSSVSGSFDLDRRAALKLLASGGTALALASCGKPAEEIVPYVATTLPFAGYGRGVLAISVDGRPIKIEGNPRHPASLGATDAFAEAEIMALYDPDRSQALRHQDDVSTWNAFSATLYAQIEKEKARRGAGLRIVSGRITSPTLLRQIDDLLKQYPEARWYSYEPLSDDAALDGSVMAYGRRLTALPRIADASVLLTLDADLLGPGPQQIANANAFAQRRRLRSQPFLRLYAVEPDWSLTGAAADHRLALHPALVRNLALAIAAEMQGGSAPDLPREAARFAKICVADLKANAGRALICVGRRQPREVHALVHWLNAQLKAPVDLIASVAGDSLGDAQSLQAFARGLDEGRVETLLILGANPAYDAPADLRLHDKIGKVAFAAQLGLYDDETAALCQWHLPQAHALESWSDLRAFDGTASIVQPLIRPLYDTRSAHDVLAFMAGTVAPSAYDLVRETWQSQAPGEGFGAWWKQALHDGVIAGTRAEPVAVGAPKRPDVKPATAPAGMALLLAPDPSVWDGRFANNAWLQECPRPFTKDVWGNGIGLSPADAARRKIADGETVELVRDGIVLRGPARITCGRVGHGNLLKTMHLCPAARPKPPRNEGNLEVQRLNTAAVPMEQSRTAADFRRMQSKLLNEQDGRRTFAVIMSKGDEVLSTIDAFAKQERISAAQITAIGALSDVVLRYFDWERKDYRDIPVHEQVEVASLIGDVALDPQGEPVIHIHLVVGRKDGTALAGHLGEAHVRPTLEVIVDEQPSYLQKTSDPETGLALINAKEPRHA